MKNQKFPIVYIPMLILSAMFPTVVLPVVALVFVVVTLFDRQSDDEILVENDRLREVERGRLRPNQDFIDLTPEEILWEGGPRPVLGAELLDAMLEDLPHRDSETELEDLPMVGWDW